MDHVKISYSNGRGKFGQEYAYIRPSSKCFNKSRRCKSHRVEYTVARYFPIVNYYKVDGFVIGAKDERSALGEYWRVCELDKIGMDFPVELITAEQSA